MSASPHAGRVALVTGAAQGIGQAIAVTLAEQGASVAVVDLVDKGVADSIVASGGTARFYRCDISQQADVIALEASVRAELGSPGILVNNAGIYPVTAWADVSFEVWRSVMAVNLDGTFLMCRHFGPAMEQAGWGRIINLVSSAVGKNLTHFVPYITSKMGIIGLTRSLASEYGVHGVTVNAIAPSLVQTPSTMERTLAPGGVSRDADFDRIVAQQAIKRPSMPTDITGVTAFLASDASAFMTGQTLYVDGGVIRG